MGGDKNEMTWVPLQPEANAIIYEHFVLNIKSLSDSAGLLQTSEDLGDVNWFSIIRIE